MFLCKYSYLCGTPGKDGIYTMNIGIFSVAELLVALTVTILVVYVFKFSKYFILTFILVMIIEIIINWLFCCPTYLNQMLQLA